LTSWVCGTNPSTLGRKRARAHPIGETESAFETELGSTLGLHVGEGWEVCLDCVAPLGLDQLFEVFLFRVYGL
jgi:hypothetical protein